MKIYGPYKRNQDGRWYLSVKHLSGKSSTISYPKYLMEQKIGRPLHDDETVDHIDRNVDNNSPSNLKIICRAIHSKEDALYLIPMTFICPWCGGTFTKDGSKLGDVINNRRKNKCGPFCSRRCAGKYGAYVGHNKIERIEIDIKQFELQHTRKYYQKPKPV